MALDGLICAEMPLRNYSLTLPTAYPAFLNSCGGPTISWCGSGKVYHISAQIRPSSAIYGVYIRNYR